ncbi:MAG: prolyl-tRNA synthetase [Candidatus Vogelbacteria bacterium]|nr:prolyl-tRNA synthetase [Candidatus Vogelbacteria bacterium]
MRQSELFTRARREAPADETAKNAKLLIRAGFIHKEMAGVYSYLPLGLRVIRKLENLIRRAMVALPAQEVLLPALQPKESWLLTGRWDKMTDLYKLRDESGREFALGPTHEEVVTPLVKNFLSSYQDLPLAIWQFQTKFRMEPRAKSGLLRGREFLMKDLYSFHRDAIDLKRFYQGVINSYRTIFKTLGLESSTYLTLSGGGTFAEFSHEFQTLTAAGEDLIRICADCHLAVNEEIKNKQPVCPSCGSPLSQTQTAIETANIFELGTKFSRAFNLTYRDQAGSDQLPFMGCYGFGVSRLLGALVEIMADERGLIWPPAAAPFRLHLLSFGSANGRALGTARELYDRLQKIGCETLWDDRAASAGEKLAEADLIGIPYRVVVSDRTLAVGDKVELTERRDSEEKRFVTADELCAFLG